MAKKGKYQVPTAVKQGRAGRKASHALGNSRVSGYRSIFREESPVAAGVVCVLLGLMAAVGLFFVIF